MATVLLNEIACLVIGNFSNFILFMIVIVTFFFLRLGWIFNLLRFARFNSVFYGFVPHQGDVTDKALLTNNTGMESYNIERPDLFKMLQCHIIQVHLLGLVKH